MTFLDLCAGIGGFSLGLERAGMTCVGQVEIDDYCNRILARHWPHVPRWGDITALDPAELPAVDLIAGGYPCQPFSIAGQRQGVRDDRHLWPHIFEIVSALRPSWCLFENVAGHITLGLDAVLSDLEGLDYTCGPIVIPACAVDAPHRRDRLWILAHTECPQWRQGESSRHDADGSVAERQEETGGPGTSGAHGGIGDVADAEHRGCEGRNAAWERPGAIVPLGKGRSGCCGILPDSACIGWREGRAEPDDGGQTCAGGHCGHVSDADSNRLQDRIRNDGSRETAAEAYQRCSSERSCGHRWAAEPRVGRVAHGVPRRVDRIRSLGNAVVPQIVEAIGRAIMTAAAGDGRQ